MTTTLRAGKSENQSWGLLFNMSLQGAKQGHQWKLVDDMLTAAESDKILGPQLYQELLATGVFFFS